MIIEAGEGMDAVILNTDKVLTVRTHMTGRSDVTFTNGQRRELHVTEVDFAYVEALHHFRLPGGGGILVNLDNVMYATPTWTDDRMGLKLDSAAEPGSQADDEDVVVVLATAAELSGILRKRGTPGR